MEVTKIPETIRHKFCCKKCHYITSHKGDYTKHIKSYRHNGSIQEVPTSKNSPDDEFEHQEKFYYCSCGKKYKTHGGCWKHKQKCLLKNSVDHNMHTFDENSKNYATGSSEYDGMEEDNMSNDGLIIDVPINEIVTTNELTNDSLTNAIVELIKQNNDLRTMIIEQNKNNTSSLIDVSKHITNELVNAIKNGQIGTTTNIMNNSHNTTFNLQVFLNETCKDALNIDEFIENIKVTNADLEETARLGYSSGISRIFLNELNALDITKKPIHCSDAKREIIYIKENDVWEKDDAEKTRLIKAVKQTARKNYMHIFEWEKDYPQYKKDPDSKLGKLYNKIVCNSMSGSSNAEQIDNINKIVKIIIKSSIINKQLLLY